MEPEPPGAAFFCLELEPEPTQVGQSRSRSQLRDLGDLELEPEPPKKVAAQQHWFWRSGGWKIYHVSESSPTPPI